MKKWGRNTLWVLVLMLVVGIAAGIAYTHREEEMVGGSVIVLNYSDVDFYPSVRSLDEKGQVTASAGYPVGPRAGGGGAGVPLMRAWDGDGADCVRESPYASCA